MSELDDKLKELIADVTTDHDTDTLEEVTDEYVAQIKQAFADAGYITPEQVKKTQELVNQMANLANDMAKLPVILKEAEITKPYYQQGLMTGQEWYDRFEKEFENQMSSDPTEVAYEADKAAKRASGLTDE